MKKFLMTYYTIGSEMQIVIAATPLDSHSISKPNLIL